MHRSVLLNIAHGQAIENTKYMDIFKITYKKTIDLTVFHPKY